MPSETQLLKGTIHSLEATVKFQESRGEIGDYARLRALCLLDRTRTKLTAVNKRAALARKEAALAAKEDANV